MNPKEIHNVIIESLLCVSFLALYFIILDMSCREQASKTTLNNLHVSCQTTNNLSIPPSLWTFCSDMQIISFHFHCPSGAHMSKCQGCCKGQVRHQQTSKHSRHGQHCQRVRFNGVSFDAANFESGANILDDRTRRIRLEPNWEYSGHVS